MRLLTVSRKKISKNIEIIVLFTAESVEYTRNVNNGVQCDAGDGVYFIFIHLLTR